MMQRAQGQGGIARSSRPWRGLPGMGLLIGLICLLLSGGPAAAQGLELEPPATGAAGWQAGSARVEMTPPAGISLAGYLDGSERVADGVETPLYARATVLADASGTSVIIVSLDIFGIFSTEVERIRRDITRRLTIDPHRIIVTATHTHSGPDAIGPWGGWSAATRMLIRESAVQAAHAALEDVSPVAVAWTPLDLAGLIVAAREGSATSTVGLAVRLTEPDGGLKGMLVHVPARADTLGPESTLISADYPGHLAGLLEEALGGTVMVLPGLSGDQRPQVAERGDGAPANYGASLAERVLAADGWTPVAARDELVFRHLTVELPVTNWRLHTMAQFRQLDRSASHGRIQPQMAAFTVGPIVFLTVPGEGFQRLHEAWRGDGRVVVPMGPANDYVGALVPAAQYAADLRTERYTTSRHAAELVEAAGEGLLQQLERVAQGLAPRPEQVFAALDGVIYIVPSRSVRLAEEGVYSRAAATQRRVLAVVYGTLLLLLIGIVVLIRRFLRPRRRRPRRQRRAGGKVVQGPRPVGHESDGDKG